MSDMESSSCRPCCGGILWRVASTLLGLILSLWVRWLVLRLHGESRAQIRARRWTRGFDGAWREAKDGERTTAGKKESLKERPRKGEKKGRRKEGERERTGKDRVRVSSTQEAVVTGGGVSSD